MPITEIALLRLLPPTTADNVSLRSKLATAKAAMRSYTGRRFYYLQQIEDPSLVYVLGEWDSLDQHMNGFIPSADNQAVLESLKDELTVDWLLHMDAPHAALPLPRTGTTEADKNGASSRLFSIERHFIRAGEKDKFKETFEGNHHYLQDYATEGRIGGGWRVDKDGDKEEFILWCPWKDVEQHHGFTRTDGFDKYATIRDFMHGAETKHAKMMDL